MPDTMDLIDSTNCQSSPCLQYGTCLDMPNGGYMCLCFGPHTGMNCEICM